MGANYQKIELGDNECIGQFELSNFYSKMVKFYYKYN